MRTLPIVAGMLVLGLAAPAAVACDPCGYSAVMSAPAYFMAAPRVVQYVPAVQQAPVYSVQAAPVAAPCQAPAALSAPAYAPAVMAAPQVVQPYAVPSVPLAAVRLQAPAVYAPAASAVVVQRAAVKVQAAPVVKVQAAPARGRGLFGGLFRGRAESAAAAGGGQAVQQRGLINLNR